jgi:hypothetical protein
MNLTQDRVMCQEDQYIRIQWGSDWIASDSRAMNECIQTSGYV